MKVVIDIEDDRVAQLLCHDHESVEESVQRAIMFYQLHGSRQADQVLAEAGLIDPEETEVCEQ